MELKYLHTFLTIVSAGSFSRAAERLSYTQSAITFQVAQLEDELGVKLFEKVGRKMALTQAASALCPMWRTCLPRWSGCAALRGSCPCAGGTCASAWARRCCATGSRPSSGSFTGARQRRGCFCAP